MTLPFQADEVQSVVAYLMDQITTDIVCFDVEVAREGRAVTITVHEERSDWQAILQELGKLPGFDTEWFGEVCIWPFKDKQTVLFKRSDTLRQS